MGQTFSLPHHFLGTASLQNSDRLSYQARQQQLHLY